MKIAVVIFLSVICDQLTKYIALLMLSEPIWLVDHIGFELTLNPAVAFSLPLKGPLALVVAGTILAVFLIVVIRKCRSNWISAVVIGMIAGGALGNIIDRIRLGAVVDFIRIGWWPNFNIADFVIVAGCLLLVLFYDKLWRKKPPFSSILRQKK
jgi:signal peptidase II